MSSVGVKCACV